MSRAQVNLGKSIKFSEFNIPDIGEIIDLGRKRLGLINGNGGAGTSLACADPRLRRNEEGICEFPGSPAGGMGEAVMGQFGAALEPFFFTINQRRCLPGMILGKDKLCYNIGAISNKERLWPKGTAPLLTGGEMAAIRKADTARGKVARTAKRLGIQPATRRAARPKPHAHAKAATGVVNV